MFVIIDSWEDIILGYCESEDAANKIAVDHYYCTGHKTYSFECKNLGTEYPVPKELLVCAKRYKNSGDIGLMTYTMYQTFVNEWKTLGTDFVEKCKNNEVERSEVEAYGEYTTYAYFTIETIPDENRKDLEKRCKRKAKELMEGKKVD